MDKVRNGMKEVKVSCEELQEVITKNRDLHLADYGNAMVGYEEKLVEKLTARVEEAKRVLELALSGNFDDEGVHDYEVPKPNSYEKEYNRAIKMTSMSADPEMVLDQQEFDRYVMDEWSWKNSFSETTKAYNNIR